MAGRFDTIAGIDSVDEIVDAIVGVAGSGSRVAAEDGIDENPTGCSAGAANGRRDVRWCVRMTMVFVVAEVALVGVLIMHRLRDLEEQLEDSRDTAVLRRLADARPATDHFDWLKEATNRTNVFVTMLLGGGVLVSGVLWVIDKVAGRSVATSRERKLAGELQAMAFPASRFVPPDSVLFAADLDRDELEDLALLLLGRTEAPQ